MTTPDECEKLYNESLWCLYALQDDLLQVGNPFMDEDRETISTCALRYYSLCAFSPVVTDHLHSFFCRYSCAGITRTKLRLVRCQARMAMNHRDRVNDARADQNLADVARIPAPWEVGKVPQSPQEQQQLSPAPSS